MSGMIWGWVGCVEGFNQDNLELVGDLNILSCSELSSLGVTEGKMENRRIKSRRQKKIDPYLGLIKSKPKFKCLVNPEDSSYSSSLLKLLF